MQRFEYKVLAVKISGLHLLYPGQRPLGHAEGTDVLNGLGAEGWQVAGVLSSAVGTEALLLQRPLEPAK